MIDRHGNRLPGLDELDTASFLQDQSLNVAMTKLSQKYLATDVTNEGD